jgi:hypothetical protein
MKKYPKSFEDVYSSEYAENLCKLGSVSSFSGIPTNEYAEQYQKVVRESLSVLWDITIRMRWMERQFIYDGKRRTKKNRNGMILDSVFSSFFRNKMKNEYRTFSLIPFVSKIETYFDDLYPDFDYKNPMSEPKYYLFPYKNITPDFLPVVYQMPERLDLLREADESMMSYPRFLDYVINYVFSYNEEVGKDIYIFMKSTVASPYVKYTKYPEYKIKKRKRGKNKKI